MSSISFVDLAARHPYLVASLLGILLRELTQLISLLLHTLKACEIYVDYAGRTIKIKYNAIQNSPSPTAISGDPKRYREQKLEDALAIFTELNMSHERDHIRKLLNY